MMQTVLLILKRVLLTLFGLAAVYFLAVGLGGLIPVGSRVDPAGATVEAFVATNGLHAEFVVPVVAEGIDWRPLFPVEDFARVDSSFSYLRIGWGERGFYLRTPTWDDLTVGTTLAALFWPTPAVLHVDYRPDRPNVAEDMRPLPLTGEQYQRLSAFIKAALPEREGQAALLIRNSGYGPTDNFYEAKGRYHLFYTCNNWTNGGLKAAGVRTALWTPLEWGVMRWR